MKTYKPNIVRLLSISLLLGAVHLFASCESTDDGKYKMTDGLPEVRYVRLTDPAVADSLIVQAFMEQNICLVGNNLRSIQEIYFNDQKAVLNQNFITSNALIVNIPKNIPQQVTDKIYMITAKSDTVEYDFRVMVPEPSVRSMKCEFVEAGDVAIIRGDYFIDDPNIPLEVIFAGNIKAEVVNVTKTEVEVIVPEGALEGPVLVKSLYGNGRSTFMFRDSRGWITGFEDSENGGKGFQPGWGRPAKIEEDSELSLMGKYVRMEGDLGTDDGGWVSGGDGFTINIWGKDSESDPNIDIPNPMFDRNMENPTLKCEVNVLQAWSAVPMIFVFAEVNNIEGWKWADTTQPRAFWAPWTETGSYVSNGWVTVSIPITDFKYNGSEEVVSIPSEFGQLGIALHNRGGKSYIGTPCSPIILVDNIRIVPGE